MASSGGTSVFPVVPGPLVMRNSFLSDDKQVTALDVGDCPGSFPASKLKVNPLCGREHV
jgi:hypothetical protein